MDLFNLLLSQRLSLLSLWQSIAEQKDLFEPFIWPTINLFVGLLLLNLLILSIHIAGIYSLTNQAVSKQKASIRSYFKAGFSKFLSVFVLFLLITTLSLPFLAFAGWIDYSLLQSMTHDFSWENNGWMWIIGILLSLLIFFICILTIMLLTLFAPVALFAEETGPIRALARSFRHVCFSFKRVSLTVVQLLILFLITVSFILVLNSPILFAFLEPFLVGTLANLWNMLINFFVLPILYAGICTTALLLLFQRYHRYLIPDSSVTNNPPVEDSFTYPLKDDQTTDL